MNGLRRKIFALAGALALPRTALAQPLRKVSRLGWLEPGTPAASAVRTDAFREALRALGWSERENIVTAYRHAHGKLETFPALAEDLVRLAPDCIFAVGIDAIRALKRLTDTIPIVMGTVDVDPVRAGIVKSLARPGGNVTGLTGIAHELAAKRLELLKEILPGARRMAVVFDPRTSAGHAHVEGTQSAARKLGIELHLFQARSRDDLERAFSAAREREIEGLSLIAVGLMLGERQRILQLAAGSRIPVIYSNSDFVSGGGLIAYAPDITDQFRRAALFVDKILKGAKPADLPVEQPTRFELAINLKTAEALGIRFPQTILVRADRVIER